MAVDFSKFKPKPDPKPDPKPKPFTPPKVTPVLKSQAPKANPIRVQVRPTHESKLNEEPEWATIRNQKGDIIHLDEDQIAAVKMAISGKSFALIGPAGSGKTTTYQAIILAILQAHADQLRQIEYRIKGEGRHVPGLSMAIVAFANRAANNMRAKAQAHPDLKDVMNYNITTLHNLLEYTVEFLDDPETGKTKRRYYPQKDEFNKLEVTHLGVEEASQVPVGDGSIWDQMYRSLQGGTQIIFLGDVNQLPPVGGKPVLAYAMRDLPVVELRTIHRQALDNPIIRQAHHCLKGKSVEQDTLDDGRGVRVFHPEQISKKYANQKLSAHQFRSVIKSMISQMMAKEQFDPYQDVVLLPNNKDSDNLVTTPLINAEIAWMLAKHHNRVVHEINAGFNKVYVAVGDKVMVDKYEGIVVDIKKNASYIGKVPKEPSTTLNYHGVYVDKVDGDDAWLEDEGGADYSALDIDAMLNEEASTDERTRAASHNLTIELEDGSTVTLSAAGEFGAQVFSLGYAITFHKAQGSEWRNVILAMHDSAGPLIFRELFYTGMTRAVERLDIIAHKHTMDRAIRNPRIKGHSLEDKLEFFRTGYLDKAVPLIPGEDA